MKITFKNSKELDIEKVEKLYNDVGWVSYTKKMEVLQQALRNSLEVITAWHGEELIGLIRAVGDGLTILYVQDILVLNAYQNQGVATQLMDKMLEKFKNVRQKVLLTEEAPDVRHFYEKNEFQSCDQGRIVAFAKFN
ncbi:GNAT family N-acetyltransferase [Ruoffia tabacinasalis]|uniref:GNAT family N-acetyltransferase n=1 Tax=Ruoffia tabacinasalis TaxID=87458 RepID=UPI0030CEEA84